MVSLAATGVFDDDSKESSEHLLKDSSSPKNPTFPDINEAQLTFHKKEPADGVTPAQFEITKVDGTTNTWTVCFFFFFFFIRLDFFLFFPLPFCFFISSPFFLDLKKRGHQK